MGNDGVDGGGETFVPKNFGGRGQFQSAVPLAQYPAKATVFEWVFCGKQPVVVFQKTLSAPGLRLEMERRRTHVGLSLPRVAIFQRGEGA